MPLSKAKEKFLARTAPQMKATDLEPRGGEGFVMKTFFPFLVFNPDFEGKITLRTSKIVYAPQVRYTGAEPTTGTMLTKPTKSSKSNKLTVPHRRSQRGGPGRPGPPPPIKILLMIKIKAT